MSESQTTTISKINTIFVRHSDEHIFNSYNKLIESSNNNKFLQHVLDSPDQIPLIKEIVKQRLRNGKDVITRNTGNTTAVPLITYGRDNRKFNLRSDCISGGFETVIDESAITHYNSISLTPNTTTNAAIDKQKNRDYTKFMFNIVKDISATLVNTTKVHFILESIAYIMYKFDFDQDIPDDRQNDNVKLYFVDDLNDRCDMTKSDDSFCVNASDDEEICHAIRAILLACSIRRLCHNHDICIYLPIRYRHQFDYDSNLHNSPKLIDTTFRILFNTVTSLLNGVVPKTQIHHYVGEGRERRMVIDRGRVNFNIHNLNHKYDFQIRVQDFYSAMCIIAKSYGIMYFNGRNYNANFNETTNASQFASHINFVPCLLRNRLAFCFKFLQYKCMKFAPNYSRSRIGNKLLWLTRKYFLVISYCVKHSLGSFCPSKIRKHFGQDYIKYIHPLEDITDNYGTVTVVVDGEKVTLDFFSLSRANISPSCDIGNHEAYTQSADFDPAFNLNRSRAWFGHNLVTEPNGQNYPINDKCINHNYPLRRNNLPSQKQLFLIDYCNRVTNWNHEYFGNLFNDVEAEIFHTDDNMQRKWINSKKYYKINGLCGSCTFYGRTKTKHYDIYCYNNSLVIDAEIYCIPWIYRIKEKETNNKHIDFMLLNQDYSYVNNVGQVIDYFYFNPHLNKSLVDNYEYEDFD